MSSTDKYDRQLRLWGGHGQRALMNANILLITGDGSGSETLKNLVLPGVGNFTIIDDQIVNHSDLGVNFFVDDQSIGLPRAEVVTSYLCEMNTDVRGSAIVDNIVNLLAKDSDLFANYSLVISSNVPEKSLLMVSESCSRLSVPLVYVQSYGLLGRVRLQITKHQIIESKPDNAKWDLRISNPFNELLEYSRSVSNRLDSMDSLEHSHTPYIVLLIIAMDEYKRKNNNNLPITQSDKDQFLSIIKSYRRHNNEDNFDEAIRNAYIAYSTFNLPAELIELLNEQRTVALSSTSTDFDLMLRALDIYITQGDGTVPLNGSLPDVTSTTELFLQLQGIYQHKASRDRGKFKSILVQLLQSVGRSTDEISDEFVDLFCKNTNCLSQLTTRPLVSEWNQPNADSITEAIDDPYIDSEQTPLLWYLGLQSAHRFHSQLGRWPGEVDDEIISDIHSLNTHLHQINEVVAIDGSLFDKISNEIVRFGGREIHTVSAVVGGVAAQEAVKILTHQYVPINNSYIFNGIAGCGATYEL